LVPPPVTLASFTLAVTSVVGTNDVTGTLTLTGAAPAPGVEVELTSSNPGVASVPPVVTVPAGATSATFIVTTSLVTADMQVTITALHATTQKTGSLTVLHPSGNYVASATITPAFITGGTSANGTVTLALPSSDHGGSDVTLMSSNAALSVPASVKVNPNATTATFTVAATAVTGPVPVMVTASYGGVRQRIKVVVAPQNAVTLASLTIVPNRVTGGSPALATMTLNRPAPFGGAQVTIEARRRNIVTVPNTVVVPEGATFAPFTIATDPLHAAREKSVEIAATYNNITASAALTVVPSAQAVATHAPVAICASLGLLPCLSPSSPRVIKPVGGQDGGPPPPTAPTLFERQYTFYTPELSLLSETPSTSSTTVTPVVAYDYVWFGGQPLAQIENATGNIAWYVNDHLGTPIRQTDPTGRVLWQAEYEPYGTIYAIRRGNARHQPLRLPGQTAEDGSDLYQNVFRFYRARWGRYTQPDPLGLFESNNTYTYVDDDPIVGVDPLGLRKIYGNWCGPNWTGGFSKSWNQLTLRQRHQVLPPVDALDDACQLHDLCYGACGTAYPCYPDGRSTCFRDGDRALTERAYKFGGFWGNAVGDAIDRPGKRDPGPNASNCCGPTKPKPTIPASPAAPQNCKVVNGQPVCAGSGI
jgi:RHS repeat-associated protein